MEYNKIIEQIKTRVSIEEFNEKQEEFNNDAKNLGIKPEMLEQYIVRRWTTYFSKALTSYGSGKKVKVNGVILSLQQTDFGAKKKFEAAVKYYSQDPQMAIQQGYVDSTGNPTYEKGWNKGQKIDPEKLTLIADGMFSIDGADYKMGSLNLGKDNIKVPMNTLVSFEATQSKTDDGSIKLNKNKITKFTIEKELTTTDIIELLENYAPGMLISIPEALITAKNNYQQKQETGKASYQTIAVIGDMGSDGVNILGDDKKNDVMTLVESDNDGTLLEKTQTGYIPISMTCWLDKQNNNITRDISSNALNVIVIGTPTFNIGDDGQERFSMNARGVIVDKNYIVKRDAETIKPQDGDESVFL